MTYYQTQTKSILRDLAFVDLSSTMQAMKDEIQSTVDDLDSIEADDTQYSTVYFLAQELQAQAGG